MLPEVRAIYIVHYFFEIGACSSNGNGLIPITWQEIKAWQELVGLELRQWELKAIKEASAAYCGMRTEAEEPDCLPPFNMQSDNQPELIKDIKQLFKEREKQ